MIKFQQSQALTSHFESFWSIQHCAMFLKLRKLEVTESQCGNFRTFSATQNLCEINFSHFEALKTALNFTYLQYLGALDIFKCEIFIKIKIQTLQNC